MKFFKTYKFNILLCPYPTEFIYSSICIKAGSKNEKDGERGLAHFFEQKGMKGSLETFLHVGHLDFFFKEMILFFLDFFTSIEK